VKAGLILGLVAALALAGCDALMTPDVEKTKPSDAQALVDSFVFVKSNKGLCFGVTTTSRMSTNATVALNQLVVPVDCDKVGL
jgi:hypothetical protein